MDRGYIIAVGTALLVACGKGNACGTHVEIRGPSLNTEAHLHTSGSTRIPADKANYIGVWAGEPVWLAIRSDGTTQYFRNDPTRPVSIESSIQHFTSDGFSVGVPPVTTFFHVEKPPHLAGSAWKMSIDGLELLQIPDYGELASKHLDHGGPKDEAEAAELLQKGCDSGDMLCCGQLGSMYEHGSGVTQDPARAAALLSKACGGEELLSCAVLGGYYNLGLGVAPNHAKALELVSKACDGGEPMGCYNLAVMYDEGVGVVLDDARAAELYMKACDRGKGEACQNLALMYEDGEGRPKDLARSAALFRRACDLGASDSCRVNRQ